MLNSIKMARRTLCRNKTKNARDRRGVINMNLKDIVYLGNI